MNERAIIDAAKIAIDIAIPTRPFTFLAYFVTYISPANITPMPAIAATALASFSPSIKLNAAIAPVIINIAAANERNIRPIFPALNEYLPIRFVASIRMAITPTNPRIAKPPFLRVASSMLPNILTARAIMISPALMPSIIFPKLATSLDIFFVNAIVPIMMPKNAATAIPPCTRVLVSILPNINTTSDKRSREKAIFRIILPN